MRLLLAGILFLALVKTGLPLKCYKCNSIEECNENPKQCSTTEEFCWKAETILFGKKVVTKGCDVPIGAKLQKYEVGCGPLSVTEVVSTTCFCSTNLCNKADVQVMSQYVTYSLILFVILIPFI